MQVSNVNLLPQMGATGTGAEGAQMLSDESTFQEQLKKATDKINSTTKINTMTEEEVAQRNQEIKDASVQLEALLLKMMYNEMWKTVPKSNLFGENSNAMDIYRDMYNEELTKKMAEGGGIGLSDYIYKQLTKNQS